MNKIPRPPIGLPVQYFPNAKRNAVCAARVLATFEQTITVDYRAPNGHMMPIRSGVWWAGDPTLSTKDQTALAGIGTWDFIPGVKVDLNVYEGTPPEPPAPPEKKPTPDTPEVQELVCLRYKEGESPVEIAETLGWSHQKVNAILRSHGMSRRDND
jgi:hypothetical protein